MKAIKVKYMPATDFKPSRMKASDCDGNSVTISYDHDLSGSAIFAKAAIALCKKMGWTGKLVSGGLKDCEVFCFVEAYGHPCETFDL